MGYFKTALLLSAMTALFLAVGYLLGGQSGIMIALVVALALNFFAYWNSDKMVLGMYGARRVTRDAASGSLRDYYKIVEELAQRARLPMPKVYVLDNAQPNAFATGRNPEHAAVAASTGLLNILSRDEIAGVMAHELSHVKHRDTLIMTLTATFAGAIGMLANFAFFFGNNRNNSGGVIGKILVMLLAPFAAMLVQMAISRGREYEADYSGAKISGHPLDLASALEKLQMASQKIPNVAAERNPATAHLFIVNPLQGKAMDNLFSTHPNMENRIMRLRAMATEMGNSRSPQKNKGTSRDNGYSSAYPKSKPRDESRYGSSDRYRSGDRTGRESMPQAGPVNNEDEDQGKDTRKDQGKDKSKDKRGPWG